MDKQLLALFKCLKECFIRYSEVVTKVIQFNGAEYKMKGNNNIGHVIYFYLVFCTLWCTFDCTNFI